MIIVIAAVVIGLIVLLYKIYHDKLMFLNIKLTCAEEKIKASLIKEKELLKDSESLIKKLLNTEKDIYDNFENETTKSENMIELDRTLLVYVNEFNLIKNKYKKLGVEEVEKLSFQINETNDQLTSYKEYYNNVVNKYNYLIRKFPIVITNIIKRRKQRLYFD